jgi:hypothetical protein
MWECQTQENNNSGKYEQYFVTYVEFIYDRKPKTPRNYSLHNYVQYSHGISIFTDLPLGDTDCMWCVCQPILSKRS